MIEHHLQKGIVADLVECETARYADLKPTSIEGNVFTYHLNALIKAKLIAKTKDGTYRLTNKGKLYGINVSLKKRDVLRQAHSIMLLSVREGESWLLRKRSVQPMYGRIGFIHGEPAAGETIQAAAARELKRRTELEAEFRVKGSGYICLNHEAELVAYSHFTLLEANTVRGNLRKSDPHGENFWVKNPDFSAPEMIPSMPDLAAHIKKSGLFFADLIHDQ